MLFIQYKDIQQIRKEEKHLLKEVGIHHREEVSIHHLHQFHHYHDCHNSYLLLLLFLLLLLEAMHNRLFYSVINKNKTTSRI